MRKKRVMSEAILDETGRLADSFESGDFDTDDLVAIAGQARLFVDTVRILMRERDEARAVADQCKDTIAELRLHEAELRAELARLQEQVVWLLDGRQQEREVAKALAGTGALYYTENK